MVSYIILVVGEALVEGDSKFDILDLILIRGIWSATFFRERLAVSDGSGVG